MYGYIWDKLTGGLLLTTSQRDLEKDIRNNDIRPVYASELDLYRFKWKYDKQNVYPYMWAESNNYYYYGKKVATLHGACQYKAPKIEYFEEPEINDEFLKPIDVEQMIKKNAEIIGLLTKETESKIINYYKTYYSKVDVFYVAFSGGKDSLVCLDLVQKTLPHNQFKVLFGDTQMEFSDTYDLVDEVELWCKKRNIEFIKAQSSLNVIDAWNLFGPPAQTIRWCCSVMKSAPQIIKLREVLNKRSIKSFAFTGIRSDESNSRSEYSELNNGEKIRGQISCHPILNWSTAEVFLYLLGASKEFDFVEEENAIPFNLSYKKGNGRVGCLMCPMASDKSLYVREQNYNISDERSIGTSELSNIIIKTSSVDFVSSAAQKEFLNCSGWGDRRSGLVLRDNKRVYDDYIKDGELNIVCKQLTTDWKEWMKTIGTLTEVDHSKYALQYKENTYMLMVANESNTLKIRIKQLGTKESIKLESLLKNVFRKSSYCVFCRVCESNCPFGYISMKNGQLSIDNQCIKCQKCHDILKGCLRANSLYLPKGAIKMTNSVNRYNDMGFEYIWVKSYFMYKEKLWGSSYDPGNKKSKNLLKNTMKKQFYICL